MTLKANLNFNVNSFRNWIKQKLIDDSKYVVKIGDDGEKINVFPKLRGVHVALTALNEKLCHIILEKVIERISKDISGLYRRC